MQSPQGLRLQRGLQQQDDVGRQLLGLFYWAGPLVAGRQSSSRGRQFEEEDLSIVAYDGLSGKAAGP